MVTNLLNRPLNTHTNRVGLGSDWKGIANFNNTARLYSALSILFLELFLKIIFKSGEIFMTNPFFSNVYFFKALYSLPVLFHKEEIFKFFRPVRLKYTTRFRSKRNFLARKFLKYINFSNLSFYIVNKTLIVLLYIYIPEPIKRFNYILNLDLNSRDILSKQFNRKMNFKVKLNRLLSKTTVKNIIKKPIIRHLNLI